MADKENIELIFNKYECTDFKWIDPSEIVTAQWVRTKCIFGCANYEQKACCPPNVPSVAECTQLFNEYATGVIFHFAKTVDKPEDRHEWGRSVNQNLLSVERDIFLMGYQKTFLLPITPCNLCDECAGTKVNCKNPKLARPTPEGMAIDVYSTARKFGFPIQVLSDYSQTMNRYAFLLIE